MSTKERPVSLWAGNAESRSALNDYLEFPYDEDGIADPCPFGKDFQIDWFDEDFLEAGFKEEKTQSLRRLLTGHSDADELSNVFCALVGDTLAFQANVVVLLYDFMYDGAVKSAQSGSVNLFFVGTVK